MPGRPTSLDGIRKAIMVANPHLDAARDDRAVRRLALVYKLCDALQKDIEQTKATGTARGVKTMDEIHKLYADALRLEQELGITPAARARQGLDGDGATHDGLGGVKG